MNRSGSLEMGRLPALDASKALPVGTVLNGTTYRVERVLGQGSYGITYLVTDTILNRTHAMKEFFPQDITDRDTSVSLDLRTLPINNDRFDMLKERFISEARALSECIHPGIVRIWMVIPALNTIYYLMDHIEGVTLHDRYAGHPLDVREATDLLLKIAEPLVYLHGRKITHFDLNPRNIMIRPDGSVVIIDFGFAKRYDNSGKQRSMSPIMGGTPGYMAPEIFRMNSITEFTVSPDVYALGGILYFLLTGETPPDCQDITQDEELLTDGLPEELKAFVSKAMAIKVRDRFQSVTEFCNALEKAVSPKERVFKIERNSQGKYNFRDSDGQLLSDIWFDSADDFRDGFACVELDGKRNFINKDGKYLADKWFDYADSFRDGFACVNLDGKWNFINKDGKFLSEKWFDDAKRFNEGFAGIKLDCKWNFINKDGIFLSDNWFDFVGSFMHTGEAMVFMNGKNNFIDKEGKLLLDKWIPADDPDEIPTLVKKSPFQRNFIKKDGKYISDKWFDWAYEFSYGFACVYINHKYNFINNKGNYLSDKWFDDATSFNEGFARVRISSKWNFINIDGKYLSDKWFDDADNFNEGFARIKLDGKWNFINKDGKYLSDKWFDNAWNFKWGFARINLNRKWNISGKWNFINSKGKFISDKWFVDASDFAGSYATVKVNLLGREFFLDENGVLHKERPY